MNHLVFDTETTGFVRKDIPLDHKEQARIIQLGLLLLDNDYNERASFSCLVRPNGWVISDGAKSVHGISMEMCQDYGLTIDNVMEIFQDFMKSCDVAIAHNIKFDREMLDIESVLYGCAPLPWNGLFCTMEATTPICRLPGKFSGKFKWPKLSEAYQHLFGEQFIDAHDALTDCRACARIYKHLKQSELVSQQ